MLLSKPIAQPKPRPRALEKDDRRKAIEARDRRESAKVKVRSGGQCEVRTGAVRCTHRAAHIHHLLGGFGVRGLGDSALPKNKAHVCVDCHKAIHAHVLVPLGGVRFQRIK